MSIGRLRGYVLASIVLRTDLQPSEARIVLTSGVASATLRLFRIVHARVDISSSQGDLVDDVIVRELPRVGAWPAEARHLLHHHNNFATLYWLTVSGPSEVEIVAGGFCVG